MKKILLVLFLFVSSVGAQQFKVKRNLLHVAKTKDDFNKLSFVVSDNNGKQIYSVEKNVPYDLPFPALKVFPSGGSVLISVFDAKLEFFNAKGEFTNEIKLADNFEYERSIVTSLSNNLACFAVCEPKLKKSVITLTDSKGTVLQQFDFVTKNVTGLAISDDDNLVAISGLNWQGDKEETRTEFLNVKNNDVTSAELLFDDGFFFENNSKFAGWTNKEIFVFDLKNKKILSRRFFTDSYLKTAAFFDNKIWYVSFENVKIKNNKWYYSNISLTAWGFWKDSVISKRLSFNNVEEIGFSKRNILYLKIDNNIVDCNSLIK